MEKHPYLLSVCEKARQVSEGTRIEKIFRTIASYCRSQASAGGSVFYLNKDFQIRGLNHIASAEELAQVMQSMRENGFTITENPLLWPGYYLISWEEALNVPQA